MSICFKEKDVRTTGRVSIGVIGMNLSENDEVVAMQLNNCQEGGLDRFQGWNA